MENIEVKAEVTGKIWKVLKSIGDHVDAGDSIMIVESMKMEIPIISEEAGTVSELRVAEGAAVADGDVVALVEAS